MFPGSVIRKLSHSEEVFAQYEVFTSMTIQLRGVIDVDALSDAFDALLETHPVLASHLEQSSDGGWNLVADTCCTLESVSSTARPPPTGHRRETPNYGSTRACPYCICS
ncbi:acyltransferase [Mycobacterium tuberculosis]|nr:acyltransferase [Mycobacterium tuberculosis]